ncbi:MAG: hypothetical protein FJ027_22335, partial [Candidatus Rokubacteria bacterium]|nr:hypothetical protein [Candidatus Rokubacteria bacterium]
MTRAVRTGVITLTLLAVVLVAATAFAAGEGGLRRIVVFRDGTPAPLQQDVVAISGSRLIRALPLINGVAIALPATNTAAALEFLRTHPTVSAVHTDPRFGVHGTILRDTAAAGAGGDGAGGDGAGGDGAGGDGAGGDGAGGDGAGG